MEGGTDIIRTTVVWQFFVNVALIDDSIRGRSCDVIGDVLQRVAAIDALGMTVLDRVVLLSPQGETAGIIASSCRRWTTGFSAAAFPQFVSPTPAAEARP